MPSRTAQARQFVAVAWIVALASQSILSLAHLSHHGLAAPSPAGACSDDARPLVEGLPASSPAQVEVVCPICSAIASSRKEFAAPRLVLKFISLHAIPSSYLRLCQSGVSPLHSRPDLSDATPRAPPA